jgi:hypothetical protein
VAQFGRGRRRVNDSGAVPRTASATRGGQLPWSPCVCRSDVP